MDTRFWGPSGWDLFHRISFHSKDPSVLAHIANILPCKFCRQSTRKFIKELPFDKEHPAEWLYKIHNKVNDKLRTQSKEDPKVIDPGPDPTFEEVKEKYKSKTLEGIHGKDFLLSVAVNKIKHSFIRELADAYPEFKSYVDKHPFKNNPKWMEGFTGGSYKDVLKYKSKCKVMTCRKKNGGGRRLTFRA